MNIEGNRISRDWTILHNGRKFYVNYTESDSHTLALLNRDNWEVSEEVDGDIEELNVYEFDDDTARQRQIKRQNTLLKEKLIRFCIENWDNRFMHGIKEQMQNQLSAAEADCQQECKKDPAPTFSGQSVTEQKITSGVKDEIAAVQKELSRYAECVFNPADIVEVRRLPSGQSSWLEAGRLTEAAESLLKENKTSQHVYISANPRRARGGTKSKDVTCGRCLFVDFDNINLDAAKARWLKSGLPSPTLTINSGHGIHAYWRLTEPITDMALWSKCQKKLIAVLDSDSAIHDPARIMRLPGFVNNKEPKAACRVIDARPEKIDLESLLDVLDKTTLKSGPDSQVRPKEKPSSNTSNNDGDVLKRAVRTAAKWDGVRIGKRNCTAFQHAAYLVKNLGLSEAEAWPVIKSWNLKNRPPLQTAELRQTLQNAITYGRHQANGNIAA